jgi:hypothetical protein
MRAIRPLQSNRSDANNFLLEALLLKPVFLPVVPRLGPEQQLGQDMLPSHRQK